MPSTKRPSMISLLAGIAESAGAHGLGDAGDDRDAEEVRFVWGGASARSVAHKVTSAAQLLEQRETLRSEYG